MTDTERDELRIWAEAHATVGSRTAQLVLVLLGERERLSGTWNEAVNTYPQPIVMPAELREWWRRIYERITGAK